MNPRVAVVSSLRDDGWSEAALVVRRVAGALGCQADVDLLVTGATRSTGTDGAVRVVGFPSLDARPDRTAALRRSLLGPEPGDSGVTCRCTAELRRQLAGALPTAAWEAMLVAAGGYSPELFEHLDTSSYDAVVFVGADTSSTYWGMDAIAGRRPTVVVAAAAGDPGFWSPAVDDVLDGADRVVVTTPFEADLVRRRAPALKEDQLRQVGFVVQVNAMAKRAPAFGFDGRPTVVVARNWDEEVRMDLLVDWCDALVRDFGSRLAVRLAGPGAQRVPRRLRAEFASSRTDVWRWMAHATCLLDPEPDRLLGREVLEAMLFATPVVVPADGGATRVHAEDGNAGLWYRSYEELRSCVAALVDGDLKETIGGQARAYAAGTYGDTGAFVAGVNDAVLELV